MDNVQNCDSYTRMYAIATNLQTEYTWCWYFVLQYDLSSINNGYKKISKLQITRYHEDIFGSTSAILPQNSHIYVQ
jgi:hypothetical protein